VLQLHLLRLKVEPHQVHSCFFPARSEFLELSSHFYNSFAHMPPYTGVEFTVTLIEKVHNDRLKEQFYRSWKYFFDNNYPQRSCACITAPMSATSRRSCKRISS
jgi:hypothetical protein